MNKPILAGILPTLHQGKVRDSSELPKFLAQRVIDTTDRVSTHDIPHLSLIPDKGQILLALTLFWEQKLKHQFGVHTHTRAFGREIYDYLPKGEYPSDFHLHAIIADNAEMLPWELIYRARMAGSLWNKYYSKGLPNPYGLKLPEGMQLMEKFPAIIFTPTDKSKTDDPVNSAAVTLQERSAVRSMGTYYEWMRNFALERGTDIIDFKGEMGFINGMRVMADEWGTPDCCRFVDAKSIVIGEEPKWLDKEYLRQEALSIWKREGKGRFPVTFSPAAIQETRRRNHEIVERLTGRSLSQLQKDLGMT